MSASAAMGNGRSLRIVVVGAGIGGLGSALALSRAGHRVTVVERDDTPMPADPEAAFDWDRRGAPQVRHPHVFLGLARVLLRDRFPDILATLTDMGVEPPPLGSGRGPGMELDEATLAVLAADDDLRMLPCRRTTFEWVMRRAVLEQQGVTFLLGHGVRGVSMVGGTVTGVCLDDGTTLHADLVVATTGRRGDVPGWLAQHGVEIPETVGQCGVVYFSRFYRSEVDEGFGFRGGLGAGIGFGVIGSDAGTYSITAVVAQEDKELRAHLSDSERFDKTMRLLPELADVAAIQGNPLNEVHYMTGLVNRTRTFTAADGSPLVPGLVAVGDAHTCTNPAYGRGQSLALRQAVALADALGSSPDVAAAQRAFEAASVEGVLPWYHFSVLTDQMRASALASGAADGGGDGFGALFTGAGADPEVVHTLLRVMNLLEPPQAIIGLLPQLQAAAAARPMRTGPKVKRLTREDLLAVA